MSAYPQPSQRTALLGVVLAAGAALGFEPALAVCKSGRSSNGAARIENYKFADKLQTSDNKNKSQEAALSKRSEELYK